MDHRYANEATFTELKIEKINMKFHEQIDALRKKIPFKKKFFQKLMEKFHKYRLNRTSTDWMSKSIFFSFITTER